MAMGCWVCPGRSPSPGARLITMLYPLAAQAAPPSLVPRPRGAAQGEGRPERGRPTPAGPPEQRGGRPRRAAPQPPFRGGRGRARPRGLRGAEGTAGGTGPNKTTLFCWVARRRVLCAEHTQQNTRFVGRRATAESTPFQSSERVLPRGVLRHPP